MSALGQKQTYAVHKGMSALPLIATAKADSRKRSCLLYPRKRTCAAHQPVPVVPDWALDQHTTEGRRMGRDLDHFRAEGTKLVPPPTGDDPYIEEAYRLWTLKAKKPKTTGVKVLRQAGACR